MRSGRADIKTMRAHSARINGPGVADTEYLVAIYHTGEFFTVFARCPAGVEQAVTDFLGAAPDVGVGPDRVIASVWQIA